MTSRALIIGGGIAGPVTAIALREVGMDPVVYEAYEHGADTVGAWLTLAANGLDALRALDLHTVVRDNGFDTHAIELSMSSGKVLGRWSMGTLPDGTPTQSISRPAIYEALRDEAVRRGVRIEYGRRLVAAEDTGRGVLARFADGTEASGDLLIGADGLRSTVRQVIDPNAPRARYVPLLNTGGYARRVPVDAAPGTMHMIIGKRCFLGYVRHPDGTVWWFANPPQAKELSRSELAAITPDQWRARLIGLFEGDLELAVRLIESSPEVFSGWNTYDFPTVPNWHNGRMVIIGDAAHAMSPAAGQGAAQAIEDAVTLAKCLRDLPDVATAFATYETIRRERVERVVRQGKANGDQKALRPVFRLLLPLIFKLKARKGEDDPHWMWQHHIEWAAPVTPAT